MKKARFGLSVLAFRVAAAVFPLVTTGWSGETSTNRHSFISPAANVLSNLVKSVRSSSNSTPSLSVHKLQVKEISVGRIPKDMLFENLPATTDEKSSWQAREKVGTAWLERVSVSPDQRRVAIVMKRDGKCTVALDGKEGAAYDEIPYRPFFSPDSRRIAYTARRGHEQFIVLDDVESKPYERWTDMYPIFSPDSKRLAFMARRGTNVMMVIDGVEDKPYRDLERQPPPEIFSPNSGRYAYAAQLNNKQWVLVLDGMEGPAYDYVREPQFSPNSRRILYVAGRKDEECIVVDGAEGSFFAGVSLFSSVGSHFSFDSKRVAFTARTKNLTHVMVVDGKPGKEYDEIEFKPVIFTPESQHTFYVAQKSRKTYVVIDDKDGPPYDRVDCLPTFSPDGKRMAYVASRGGNMVLVVDGQEALTNRYIGTPVFSPDSKHLAYPVSRGLGMAIVRDGKEGQKHTLADLPRTHILFSPDSQHVVYTVSLGGKAEFVVLEETKGKLHELVADETLNFSPDSKHVVYWAAPFSGKWHVFVDGQRTAGFDERLYMSKLAFDGPDSLHGLARRGDEILRLEIQVLPP